MLGFIERILNNLVYVTLVAMVIVFILGKLLGGPTAGWLIVAYAGVIALCYLIVWLSNRKNKKDGRF